jgi:hypothetical protein
LVAEILLAVIYKSPGSTWNDADITELLSFRHKCILAGDMNAKHPSWNSAVSNPSGQKLLQLFDTHDFEISASQSPTHYSPMGNEDVLDIVVHKNIRLSNVIVSDILDSDHLQIVFHIPDHVRTKQISEPFKHLEIGSGNLITQTYEHLTPTKGMNTYAHMLTNIHISVSVILCLLVNLGIQGSAHDNGRTMVCAEYGNTDGSPNPSG